MEASLIGGERPSDPLDEKVVNFGTWGIIEPPCSDIFRLDFFLFPLHYIAVTRSRAPFPIRNTFF